MESLSNGGGGVYTQSVEIYSQAPKSRSKKLKYMFDITIKTQKYSRGRFYRCSKTNSRGQNCYSYMESGPEEQDKSKGTARPSLSVLVCIKMDEINA